jgi:hypothetical protein
MIKSPIFGEPIVPVPWMTQEEQLDRYKSHVKDCSSCRGALKKATFIQKYSPFFSLILAILAPNTILQVVGSLVGLLFHNLAEKVSKIILGPQKGDRYSAAQSK